MQEMQRNGTESREVHNGSGVKAGATKIARPRKPKLTIMMQRKESTREFAIVLIICII